MHRYTLDPTKNEDLRYVLVPGLKRTEWEIYGMVLVPVTTDAGECDATYEFFFTIK